MRLIDADELRAGLEDGFAHNEITSNGDVLSAVDTSETIDPESLRAHGWWINLGNPITGQCSNCAVEGNKRQKYCSECGAKMDLEG